MNDVTQSEIVTMSEQNMESVNQTDTMLSDAVLALAAIDSELGMPDDGCNSTATHDRIAGVWRTAALSQHLNSRTYCNCSPE